ncbi:MAG: hypothetical protein ABH864_07025 [archaeon]
MVEQNKNVFLQALIAALIVFAIGLILGFSLEANRVDKTELIILDSEINLLDEQIRSMNIEIFNVSCDLATKSTFEFADRVYDDALKLEKYDSSSKFTNELRTIHKKYDLLRVLLWTRAIEIKQDCHQDFHTVIYLFDYAVEDLDKKAYQASMSRLLVDLKEKYGSQILLIPIASNLDLESINLIKEKYGIIEAPILIIDEEKVTKRDITMEDLENTIFEKNDFEDLEGIAFERPNLADKPEKIMLNTNKQ